jgi:hypothetical protein
MSTKAPGATFVRVEIHAGGDDKGCQEPPPFARPLEGRSSYQQRGVRVRMPAGITSTAGQFDAEAHRSCAHARHVSLDGRSSHSAHADHGVASTGSAA